MTEVLDETTETPETPEEPETDEETPDEPSAPETPAEEPAPPSQADDEAMAKVFDKARSRANTYMKAVPDILGSAAADLHLCPRCTDFLPGYILPPTIKPVVGDQLVAVKMSIGEGLPVEYVQADDAEMCSACQGRGKVKTGSLAPQQDVLRCRHCKGRGWVGPRAAALSEPEQAMNGHVADEYAPAVGEPPQLDPWNRTPDDPLYGVMPGFERN